MTDDPPAASFAPAEDAWCEILGLTRDVVRQELITRQLAAHLPPADRADDPVRVLDAGCGQGTQAIPLARAGYDVVGVDISANLLDRARDAAAQESAAVQARLHLDTADLLSMGDADSPYRDAFDVVCCHGVLMYLPSLREAVAALASALCTGGLLSLVTRNRAGIAMRAGMSGDWTGALAGFDAHTYDNRVGVQGARADEPEAVFAALAAVGVDTVTWYGVRLFTDHWPNAELPSDFTTLLAAEAEAGRRDPYRRVAALTHTIGVRASAPVRPSH